MPLPLYDADGNPNYKAIGYDNVTDTVAGYQDANGNIWASTPQIQEDGSTSQPKLLVGSEVTKDPYINALGIANTDIYKAQDLYNLKQSNPTEFYNQVANGLEDKIYNDWKYNNNNYGTGVARQLLETIKDLNPTAYYTAKLTDLGRGMGWNIGQNTSERNAGAIDAIKSIVPDAIKAGLTADQINSIIGNQTNFASGQNQQSIANAASSGNFWSDNLKGLGFVASSALGMGGLDALLTGAAGAATGGMDAYAASALGSPSGAFVPAEGFSATLPAASTAGGAGAIGDQIGDYPMPGEYGTANQWIPSNINPQDVTNLLNYNAAYANGGLSASDLANYANKARQAYGTTNSLAKLLSGGTGAASTKTSGLGGGINPMQLGSLLAGGTPQTNSFIGQIKGNQNPFLFTTPGQTQASQGVYDVSGSNMANALRKA